ncbi:hypothetical protein AB0F46_39955 [Streptomyces sp. NPDC026665]|uniref:hypothetical protein n=1 Tax=Streptomyces sp. NPDC026665 TaxID=3154798 RepID=UPI003409A478
METWTPTDAMRHVRLICDDLAELEQARVLVAVSGGVDSTTTAALLRRAGARGIHLLLETGLLREDEAFTAADALRRLGLATDVWDCSAEFHEALEGTTRSSEQRDVFRNLYFDLLTRYMLDHGIEVIAQGSQGHGSRTKRAHNDPTEQFAARGFRIVEPVLGLDKSQVKAVASALRLPQQCVMRRPFPGPGLLLRFGGAYARNKVALIRAATSLVDTFVDTHSVDFFGAYQVFPYLCDGELVNYVDGDGDAGHGSVLLIRAVREVRETTVAYVPFSVPEALRDELVAHLMSVPGVARVCFDATPKYGFPDPVRGATIEYG